ncbi:MAG: 30S ribosomal protein S20 [Phycisphaerae bacterium]
MAHSLSAKKRIRQNAKRRAINRWRKAGLKDVVKGFEGAVTAGETDKAAGQLSAVYKKLDQVAASGTIHKNTASRRKSRLAKSLNRLAAAK